MCSHEVRPVDIRCLHYKATRSDALGMTLHQFAQPTTATLEQQGGNFFVAFGMDNHDRNIHTIASITAPAYLDIIVVGIFDPTFVPPGVIPPLGIARRFKLMGERR